MDKQTEEIINELIKHEITKKEAVNKLLFLNSTSSSVCKGDYIEVDTTYYGKVLEVKNETALVKYNSGVKYWLPKWRLKKIM